MTSGPVAERVRDGALEVVVVGAFVVGGLAVVGGAEVAVVLRCVRFALVEGATVVGGVEVVVGVVVL
ncbi:MAG TPA: hypothetical protein VII84_09315, partial [Acidimicrobiales bacterium]